MAKKVSCEELRNQLLAANAAYRSGESIMSDVEYDALVEKLRKLDPSDIFFNKGIVEAADDRMEELPVPMYSLEKIKEIKPLRKWLKKMLDAGACEVVAMPKFDGISLLTYDMDGDQAWTRGDGIEGQRSDAHFTRMNNGKPKGYFCNVHTWGEAICKKTTFAHLKDELNVAYKNARNMVAGVFNSSDGFKNPVITYIDFVRYGIDEPIDKDDQLRVLRNRYQNVTPSRTYLIEELLELDDADLNDLIDLELHDEFDAEYKIDGIVLEINEWAVKQQLGRLPNGNPAYSVAFKREEWCDTYQTKVIRDFYARELLVPVFVDGRQVYESPDVCSIREYSKKELAAFWEEYRRILNPHTYKVDISDKLYNLKMELIHENREEYEQEDC